MSRDVEVHLEDIITAIEKIIKYINGMNFEDFSNDVKTQDAVIRNLEIIGEASKNIPENYRKKTIEIEWKKIIALRNILIHEYFAVNLNIIWDICKNKLPMLLTQSKRLINETG